MKEILTELASEMSRVNPSGFARFNKGLSSEKIDAILKRVSILPQSYSEVLELLQWRNGGLECCTDEAPVLIMPGYMLLSWEEIVEHYNMTKVFVENGEELIPFLNDFSNAYYFYDTRDKTVVYDMPEDLEIIRYKSMECFLTAIFECYKKDIYYINDNNDLDSNLGEEESVFSSAIFSVEKRE